MLPKPEAESTDAREQAAAFADDGTDETSEVAESSQIWEHVKTLRRRVAGLN